jgi:hypothetical protein
MAKKSPSVVIVWGSSEEARSQTRNEYAFETVAELDAFLQGVEESSGWLNYEVIKTVRPKSCTGSSFTHAK